MARLDFVWGQHSQQDYTARAQTMGRSASSQSLESLQSMGWWESWCRRNRMDCMWKGEGRRTGRSFPILEAEEELSP